MFYVTEAGQLARAYLSVIFDINTMKDTEVMLN